MTDAQQEYTPEQVEAARKQEEAELQQTALNFLQNRAVLLNLEVGRRDEMLAEREARIAELEEALSQAHIQAAQTTERRRERPEVAKGEVSEKEDAGQADTDM